jgi:HK97 family phage prohead protease
MARDISQMIRTTPPRGKVKFFGDAGDVGAREFGGTISDPSTDRMSDILVPGGCDYSAFLRAGTILAQHDAQKPIARPLSVDVRSDRIYMRATFPELGVSDTADEYCRLLKAGIINSFSVGFLPRRWEPIANGGLRFTQWELLEVSLVSVPALSSAIVTERSLGRRGGSSYIDTPAGRLAHAEARAARLAGDAGVMRVHQYVPPPAPTSAELQEQDRRRRCAAAMGALAWW